LFSKKKNDCGKKKKILKKKIGKGKFKEEEIFCNFTNKKKN